MPNQAEQVIERIPMKGRQGGSLYGRPTPEEMTDNKCPVSIFRAAMISKNPARVHELVGILSENCFDVMVMRQWEPELHSALYTGLVLADLTGCTDAEQFEVERNQLIPQIEHMRVPVMYLVSADLMSRASGSLLQEELMVWPARSKETTMYQIQRAIRVYSVSPLSKEESKSVGQQVFKDLSIDRDKMIVERASTVIHLTKTEYSLLTLLLNREGGVCTREDLMSEIWDTDFLGGSNVVDVHIKSLRKKLGDKAGSPRYITTVRGVGYRLAD
ncbi:winged helix-turn-helix domain-containing protein [Paenibacillus sp. EC2-1]|uniref:winged helix-turn-helix domain-containing protein n=1 Tax=Paenibacillus sp. EC2-1 TaxID=3388665 RepID=UPI003BEEEA74